MPACPPGVAPEEVWFLLLPGFSLLSFTCALEPLRHANRLSGAALYRWRMLSRDGRPACSADGVTVGVDAGIGLGLASPPATVLVCGGESERRTDPEAVAWLRRCARFGAVIGALGSATTLLARAGLLDGYRCACPRRSVTALGEAFPDLDATANLYEADRDRLTCAGGTAALDLVLDRIGRRHGRDLAARVCEACLVERIRSADAPQARPAQARLGARHPKLARLVQLMESQLEEPLDQGALAQRVGLSRRQVERLFRRHLGCTPSQHYLRLRLEQARTLLVETDLPVVAVACATGFVSTSHFSTAYRQQFGHTPRTERLRAA